MYEETNPPDIDLDEVTSTIKKCLSEERPNVRFLYHGTYNAYDVNGKYIFRFPSTILPLEERIRLVKREVKVLEILSRYLSYTIPHPEFSDASEDIQYIGYRKIPGESLTFHFDATSLNQKLTLAESIGDFLNELHSLKIDEIRRMDREEFTVESYHQDWDRFYQRIKTTCFDIFSRRQITWTHALFTEFLNDDRNFAFEQALIHGDFDTSNVLVNPETLLVTGIIDFEETRYYDSAYDLVFLSEGKEFMSRLLKIYKGKLDSNIRDRILFLFGRQPYHYILTGMDFGLEKMVSYGLTELADRIENWEYYNTVISDVFG